MVWYRLRRLMEEVKKSGLRLFLLVCQEVMMRLRPFLGHERQVPEVE